MAVEAAGDPNGAETSLFLGCGAMTATDSWAKGAGFV